MPYLQRSDCLGIEILELRRIKADVVYVFKFKTSLVECDSNDFFLHLTTCQHVVKTLK